jgi:hypothetical protein
VLLLVRVSIILTSAVCPLWCCLQNTSCCAELLYHYSYCDTCATAATATAGTYMVIAPGHSELAYKQDIDAGRAPAGDASAAGSRGKRMQQSKRKVVTSLAVYMCPVCALDHEDKSVRGQGFGSSLSCPVLSAGCAAVLTAVFPRTGILVCTATQRAAL